MYADWNNDLILDSCNCYLNTKGEKFINNDQYDWQYITGFVIKNRVTGVFLRNAKKCISIPQNIKRNLNYIVLAQIDRNKCHREKIEELFQHIEKENILYSFLKGSVLNSLYYGEGERISNDTDILVSKRHLNKIIQVCENLGYVQGYIENDEIVQATRKEIMFAHLNTYETVPLIKKTDNPYLPYHEIDINFRLGNDDHGNMSEKMLEDTILLGEDDFQLRTMSREKFLIYLCIHLYREAIMIFKIIRGEDLVLYKFLDIHKYIYMERENLDWDKLYQLTVELDRVRDVHYSLYYTEILFPGTVDDKVLPRFGSENASYLNQYRGRDNSDEVYEWKSSFYERMFDPILRINEARENIEKENQRFESIGKELRSEDK